jgi:DNA polymerase-1
LQCLPISIISLDATEADDVIGYLVTRFETQDTVKKVTIMSADQDFIQLVSSKTQVYSPGKKKIYKPKDVLEEYNTNSKNYILRKILLGDSSDNIPGVPGLGPKKLTKLFPELSENNEYNLTHIFVKAQENLKENKLYSTLLSFKHQLIINDQLMNLKNITVTEENKVIIREMATKKNELNGYVFLSMYMSDKLGDSIINPPGWLNEIFSPLNSI